LVAVAMKIGLYFELFVIITTSIHRHYTPQDTDSFSLWTYPLLMTVLQAFLIVIFALAILKVSERKTALDKENGN
jgi:hypothetical protein